MDRYEFTYDRDSNRLTRSNSVYSSVNESYTYDDLNQLETFTRGLHTQNWSFDSAGNFTSVSTDSTPESRTHNAQNQVTGVGSTTLTFDANGNTTSDDGNRTLVYDAWNRLVAVGSAAAYAVDALGRRTQETRGETTRDLYYSAAWQVVNEKEGSDWKARQVWSLVYVDALVLRDRDANNDSGDGLEERLYVTQDANWNVTALVNTSGAAVERIVYDPYGKPTFMDSAGADRMPNASSFDWVYLHQGLRLDSIVDLYDNRARAYSATLMRFLQNDPIGFAAGDANTYRYENNGPTITLDGGGLEGKPDCARDVTIAVTPARCISCHNPIILNGGSFFDPRIPDSFRAGAKMFCRTGDLYQVQRMVNQMSGQTAELGLGFADAADRALRHPEDLVVAAWRNAPWRNVVYAFNYLTDPDDTMAQLRGKISSSIYVFAVNPSRWIGSIIGGIVGSSPYIFLLQTGWVYFIGPLAMNRPMRGITGRNVPSNLREQLALAQVMSNPTAGRVLANVRMNDPLWPASQGWVKMSQRVNGIEIHYVRNRFTGAVDDFKFVGTCP